MPTQPFGRRASLPFALPVFDYLLLKVAADCNLRCTYCYWFRDDSVNELPAVLTLEAEAALLTKLREHVERYELKNFSILFHGGEPLLLGKRRFLALCEKLRELEAESRCRLSLSMTTNGVLIDKDWAALLRIFRVGPTISIDGPKETHDQYRIDRMKRGSFDRVRRGLAILREEGIEPGLLAVCDPMSNPLEVLDFFVGELQAKRFDVLIPDATHEDRPTSIAPYYEALFDAWYERHSATVDIRYLQAIMRGLLGRNSALESIGFGPIQTCAMLTDGSLEPLDVLRIAGYRATATGLNIATHTFQDVCSNPVWLEAFEAAQTLAEPCQQCPYERACGGGFLPHRFSKERRFDNPSVYCSDLLQIFDHIGDRLLNDVQVRTPKGSYSLRHIALEAETAFAQS